MSFILLGKIGRPHGFRGDFIAVADAGESSALSFVESLFVGDGSAPRGPLAVTARAWMPSIGWKLTVEGIDSDTAVKALRGQPLLVRRSALPATESDEFYVGDLVGAAVIDAESGQSVGKFLGVEPVAPGSEGGQDRWWVEIAGKRVAVPATKRFIEKVDLENRSIWIRHLSELP